MPYLVGGISLVVLAIGSTAPGLLQFFTDKFSRVFPDYRARVLRHEAGHFLVGRLVLSCSCTAAESASIGSSEPRRQNQSKSGDSLPRVGSALQLRVLTRAALRGP